MKHCLRKIIALTLSVFIIASGTVLAATEATYNSEAATRILVTGSAAAGTPVGIQATTADGEIAHIGVAVCDDNGTYAYKFTTDVRADALTLRVSQDGRSAATTTITQKSGDLYTVKLDITDGAGDAFHLGADTKCTVRATVENKYGGEEEYLLIAALYDANGQMLDVTAKKGKFDFAASGEVEIISDEILPQECTSVKAFIWQNGTLKPLATSVERKAAESFAADKFVKKDGTLNSGYSGDITVAYLGGSITEGTGATNSATDSYASLTTEGIKKMYPNANVTAVNAGIGGTGSNSGYMRLESDVLDYNPDIVFLEYAVNDAPHPEYTVYYEGIIRRLLRMEQQPVIIALYSAVDHPGSPATTDRYTDKVEGYERNWQGTAMAEEKKVAQYYGIGDIDFDTEMKRIYDTGVQVLPTYFTDNVHYNNAGHKLYADFILDTVKANPSAYFKKVNTEKTPLLGTGGFDRPEMIMTDDARITYQGAWTTSNSGDKVAPAEGGSITFKFTGTSFALSGDLVSGSRSGASYSVDGGKYVGNVVSAQNGAYGESVTRKTNFFRLTDLADCEHTVTITADAFAAESGRFRFGFIVVD